MINIDRLCPGCMNDNGGEKIVITKDGEELPLYIGKPTSPLAVGTVQKYLDEIECADKCSA